MEHKIIKSTDLYINTPFRMTVSGGSGSGKTRWIQRFLNNHEQIVGKKFDLIMFAYGENQKLFKEIKEENPDIIWCEGFCHETILDKIKPDDSNKLLILDDLLIELVKDKLFESFFIRKSHHWNVSIIFTTQNLYDKHLRIINLNTTDYILFKSVRDITPVRVLGQQMFPTKWRSFIEIYSQATKQPYSQLYVSLSPGVKDSLRIRGNIIPDSEMCLYTL